MEYTKMYLVKQPKEILVADPKFYNDDSYDDASKSFHYTRNKRVPYCLLTFNVSDDDNYDYSQAYSVDIKIISSFKRLKECHGYNLYENAKFDNALLQSDTSNFELIVNNNCMNSKCDSTINEFYGYYINYKETEDVELTLYPVLSIENYKRYFKEFLSLFSVMVELNVEQFEESPENHVQGELVDYWKKVWRDR